MPVAEDTDEEDEGSPVSRGPLQGRSAFSIIEEESMPELSSTEANDTLRSRPTPTQSETLSRLRRRGSSEVPDNYSVPSAPSDAFTTMMGAARRVDKMDRRKVKAKSNLVVEQAEESDEDNGWLPIGNPEDENEDGLDDGFVEGLVDDEQVDDEEKRLQDQLAAAKARSVSPGRNQTSLMAQRGRSSR